jgi:hypothetical protein
VLTLALWVGASTALDLIGIWQKNGIDPGEILYLGAWIAGAAGFAAPILLFLLFRAIYGPDPRQQGPQKQKLPGA